jgi:hypothetical protein
MRLQFSPVALVAVSVSFGTLWSLAAPSPAAAKGGKANSEKTAGVASDAALSRQFKWEEGVVGPNEKKLDHNKIAAMQAAARKEEAAHKNEPTVKKTERPAGVGVPSSSTLPTMDIEKPAPVAARPNRPRPVMDKAPKSRDSLDRLLDSEKEPSRPSRHDGGLGKILAVSDKSPAPSAVAPEPSHEAPAAKGRGKHAHHGR